MTSKYMAISQAAEYLHVGVSTLRRWEREGKIKPYRTEGNERRYTKEMLDNVLVGKRPVSKRNTELVIGYCRVSSSHQKEDLERQKTVVQAYCERQGAPFRIISDVGSGLNYQKKGLQKLIHLICTNQCSEIVVNYKDRLVRFGFELIKEMCKEHDVKITVINQTEDEEPNEELVDDVLSVITVFSAKLYGKRSHKNEKIVKESKNLFSKDD